MDFRLFLSTFALIFLAELGDKTQLASFAASAGSKSPLSVFAGASAALVSATLVAVLLGSSLQRVVSPHVLKMGASILFVAFGVVLFVNALAGAPGRKPSVEAAPGGVITRLVLQAAAEFERASSSDYAAMASRTENPRLRALLMQLAEDEKSHLSRVHSLTAAHGTTSWDRVRGVPDSPAGPVEADGGTGDALESAIAHERSTAAFYEELARSAPLRSIRTVLEDLAHEERSHVELLQTFRSGGVV